MFDRPRSWKWMVPGALTPLWVALWSSWYSGGGAWSTFAPVPFGLALVCGLAAIVNLVLYVYHFASAMYSEIRNTQNRTPEVRMFEAAKGMHPEAVKALLTHRKTLWRIRYVPIKDLVDWVLDEAPNVHAGFVDFVLTNSTSSAIMPKHGRLSDGSKGFDPDDQVTDYEQYDALILLMQQKMMITQAYGNQAPQWLAPWGPDSARHRFGLDGAVTAEPETMSEALMAVVRTQSKSRSANDAQALVRSNGNGKSAAADIHERTFDGLEQTSEMKKKLGLVSK